VNRPDGLICNSSASGYVFCESTVIAFLYETAYNAAVFSSRGYVLVPLRNRYRACPNKERHVATSVTQILKCVVRKNVSSVKTKRGQWQEL